MNFEREFIGTLIASVTAAKHDAIAEVAAWFEARYLMDVQSRGLYRACLELHESRGEVTAKTLKAAIGDNWTADTVADIGNLITNYAGMWWHLNYYAGKVHETWRRLSAADETQKAAISLGAGDDVDEVLVSVGKIPNRYAPPPEARAQDNRDVMQELVDEVEGVNVATDVLPTGLPKLDDLLDGGLRPGTQCIVGARTSQGKSAFLVHLSASVAIDRNRPVLFFSSEMTNRELFARWGKWSTNNLKPTKGQQIAGLQKVRTAPIQVFAGPRRIAQIEAEARAYARHTPELACVYVDYIQQIGGDKSTGNREQEVAEVSRRLKLLAMDIGKPLVVACQLSRAADGVAPQMKHLRESGALEQDADYGMLFDPPGNGEEQSVAFNMVLAKNRHGRKGVVSLLWRKPLFRYETSSEREFSD